MRLRRLLRQLRRDLDPALRLGDRAPLLLHPGDPALRHADRVQAGDAGRLRARAIRTLGQDGVSGRARARPGDLLRRQGAGASGHRRHRFDDLRRVHRRRRGRAARSRILWPWCSRRCRFWRSAYSGPASPTASSPAVRSSVPALRSGPGSAAGGMIVGGAAGARLAAGGGGRRRARYGRHLWRRDRPATGSAPLDRAVRREASPAASPASAVPAFAPQQARCGEPRVP